MWNPMKGYESRERNREIVEEPKLDITANRIQLPKTQTVKWNPDEYKVTNIDLGKGVIEFELIKER